MSTYNITLGLSNIFVAFLIIGISTPLVMGKIPMNWFYGIRFQKSFESEENWYKINKYGGKLLIIWSLPIFLVGVITLFVPMPIHGFARAIIACAPLSLLIPAFMSHHYSKKQ